MGTREEMFSRFRRTLEWQKIEFPTLGHLVHEVRESGIETVRVDTFSEFRASELSFVYYVTTTLFVTALCREECAIYVYTERLSTTASNGKDSDVLTESESSLTRLEDVHRELREAGFLVRHGRYAQPDET
ncbi:hypothetical protein [Alicyclobacillus sp. ALC3]|uniref:hypothetical protein n=1 Tax=Alicyclobacillus sp. ALC3 TaxID=2796143 RepID=UPI0023789BE9|nr:hypothetical protein [Alicyclobacillus sp. ALC3]WDL99138.1 hypothetical protein JC200_11105 [Alicyclobacillus sp. ALC3]